MLIRGWVTFDAASGNVPELVPDSADMINGTVAVATTTQGDPVTQGGEVINSAVIQGGAAVNEVITLYNNAMAERGNGSPKFQIVFDDPKRPSSTCPPRWITTRRRRT